MVYTVAIVAFAVGSKTLGLRPRFVLTAFPLVMAIAVKARGWVFQAVLAGSAVLLATVVVLSSATLAVTP